MWDILANDFLPLALIIDFYDYFELDELHDEREVLVMPRSLIILAL